MPKKVLGVDVKIIYLGIVSFLTDVSSEMIFSVFSIFFTVILGASAFLLGIVEGLADFSASSLDYMSGFISDKTGKRKIFTILGYGFSTLAKLMLIIANSVVLASAFRVIERLGKSFRGPPRDAWISSLASDGNKGYSFGVHKALDKLGAILGPFIAYWILSAYGQNAATFKMIFWIALIPAALSVVLLIFIKEPKAKPQKRENIFKAYKTLGDDFRHYLHSAGIFSLAYFSFGFLLLKAYLVGFEIKDVVLLFAFFNVVFVIVAPPIGKLGDYIGTRKLIAAEYVIYALMSLGFIFASTKPQMIGLFAMFGIFYAIDESQSKAYITNLEHKKKATALGVYNFVLGLIYLPASLIAGYLWQIKPDYAFVFAGLISIAALMFFILGKPKKR